MAVQLHPDADPDSVRRAAYVAERLGLELVTDVPEVPSHCMVVDQREIAPVVPIRPGVQDQPDLLTRLRDLAEAELVAEYEGECFTLTPIGAGITIDLVAVAMAHGITMEDPMESVADLMAYLGRERDRR